MSGAGKAQNVLFLCTGNSARSIMAEALLNHLARGRMQAFSAGSAPSGRVNANALELLAAQGIATGGLRSKRWDSFAGAGAVAMDLVITLCDAAADEPCPYWPGAPLSAHWGLPDPAAATGNPAQIRAAFARALAILETRIGALLALPPAQISAAELNRIATLIPEQTS